MVNEEPFGYRVAYTGYLFSQGLDKTFLDHSYSKL